MFFWTFRMVGMCHALSGQVPFKEILFHGLIRDSEGRKMSKSLGNVIDPIDLIDGVSLDTLRQRVLDSNLSDKEKSVSRKTQERTYPKGIEPVGVDATRLALFVQDFKSDNINIDINLFSDARRYCNKIWQAVRYFQMSLPPSDNGNDVDLLSLNELIETSSSIDAWILSRLVDTIRFVEANFVSGYNLHLVVKKLREFFYQDFCDFYLECTKPTLKSTSDEKRRERAIKWNILRVCNKCMLLMYHPFMPSITEELWQQVNFEREERKVGEVKSILSQKFPTTKHLAQFKVKKKKHSLICFSKKNILSF